MKMSYAVACAMVSSIGGCTSVKPADQAVVYVANADSRELYVIELDESNGSSKVVQKLSVTGDVMPLAVSPDHRHLYASLRSRPYSVNTFRIDHRGGMLTLLETIPVVADMANLSTDRTGRYLFGSSYFDNKFSVNAVQPDGRVEAKPIAVIPTGKNAHAAATDPSNKFLFVSNLGEDAILQYLFDDMTGGVTPNDPPFVKTQTGAGPRHFVFHPNGQYVFNTNELDGTVNTYRLEASGTLTLLGSISVMPAGFHGKPWAADIHLTPNGTFLYASERSSSTIAAFRIDAASGKLALIGNYATEARPRGFNIDPEGKYLIAAGQVSNSITTYRIVERTGELRKLSQMAVGRNPNWIEIISLPVN
jgi:6-phosphogluconolactonase